MLNLFTPPNPAEADALALELAGAEARLKALRLRCRLCRMYRDNVLRSIGRQLNSLAAWKDTNENGSKTCPG